MTIDAPLATLLAAAAAAIVAISVPALTFRFSRQLELLKARNDKVSETYIAVLAELRDRMKRYPTSSGRTEAEQANQAVVDARVIAYASHLVRTQYFEIDECLFRYGLTVESEEYHEAHGENAKAVEARNRKSELGSTAYQTWRRLEAQIVLELNGAADKLRPKRTRLRERVTRMLHVKQGSPE